MDMIGGPSSYWLGGAFNDGKGEPQQLNSVSHGCPPARFRNINVVNTGREG
jgi:TldD protein